MAFKTAAGYGNLPNGNFSPVIYSKQVQLAFRRASTVEAITNSDYFGEIANFGDSVKILKEPEITVKDYARGTQITAQDLDDEDFTLVVDQANYFAFKIDDIEAAHSHVNFMSLASDRAAYRLRDQYDADVLGYLCGFEQSAKNAQAGTARTTAPGTKAVSSAGSDELLTSMKLGKASFGNITTTGATTAHSIPVAPRLPGATALPTATASPLMILARMARLLDTQFVDTAGRWIVIDPIFLEILKDEDARTLNADFGGSGLQNGLVLNNLHGFKVYVSNSLPKIGTGPGTTGTANQSSNFGIIVAGHGSAVATAQQITKTESYRDQDSFADIVRGMHLYGRKILRPEALAVARYNVA
jgi:hypothetical protein